VLALDGTFDMAQVVADVPSEAASEPEEEDDEEDGFSDEIPIHGVLAPEGIETGDKRGFRNGALSTRPLPVPFRYEYASTHGGMTSDVATVGRIDNAWRDEASGMWRFTGVVITSKAHAGEALDAMIDGSGPGVSIDADAMAMDMTSQTDEEWEKAFEEGTRPTEWYKAARVAGLTQVPIPAFHEAYVALGHEFQEDKTPEEREADIDTIGGLVVHLADRVPSRGELIVHPSGITFEVRDADPRRVKRVRVRNLPAPSPDKDKEQA